MVILAAVLLTVGAVLFTLLVRSRDLPASEPVSPAEHLEGRRDRIYDSLRDLQFEYLVGKLSDEDYQKSKSELQRDLERVNARITQVLGAGSAGAAAVAASAAARETGKRCPHCGTQFEVELKFCGECGKPMKGAES